MNESSIRSIPLPPNRTYPGGHQLPLNDRVLVIIGANGSGKTRLGVWLDKQSPTKHHRIAAHRALVFPERVQPMDFKEAETRLYTGQTSVQEFAHYKQHNRWQNNPATALLNDFEPLVTLMLSESFAISDTYRVKMKQTPTYLPPPVTVLDRVKQVWEAVLPNRELLIEGNRIEARNRADDKHYHAKELSDGERGIFYLIGEALSAPKDGVFIVDEPELHLHRSIQSRLWDVIEAARTDCTFVYITHDLGFAASRKSATKLWLREYTDGKWDWEVIEENNAFPEVMLLELIGSRQPILFVEGTKSSIDYLIYGTLFPEYCVMPCGSCEIVIHSTKSFAEMASLHHNTCRGLVDRDGRSDSDVAMLTKLGISVLPVALVENLFLLEAVLSLAANKLSLKPDDIVPKVQAQVFANVRANKVSIVSNLVRQEVEAELRRFGKGEDGVDKLVAAFEQATSKVDVRAKYQEWEKEIDRVLRDNDYAAALRYYKIKGLPHQIAHIFGCRGYQEWILRWLRSDEGGALASALRTALPPLSEDEPKAVIDQTGTVGGRA